jgi:hypothetical protein
MTLSQFNCTLDSNEAVPLRVSRVSIKFVMIYPFKDMIVV